jgi:hypothetical protein
MSERKDYPFYGSTFTLYRASPLYHGSNPLFTNLSVHARRLREALIGDQTRGAQLPELYSGANISGSLESCEWRLLGDEESWETAQEGVGNGEYPVIDPSEARGVHVELKFEKARHMAVLVGDQSQIARTPGFTSLPLLMIRMPAPLREIFINFLATNFDARLSPMRLRPSFLTAAVESILDKVATSNDDEDPTFSLESLSKGIGIQLSFPSAAPLLKSIDVSIPKDDLREFLTRGQSLWQQQIQTNSTERSFHRPQSPITGPFTAALSKYLGNHISMTLNNPGVNVSKIAIGPFALAGEGKVKVLASSLPAVEFWELLVLEACGLGLGKAGAKDLPDISMEDAAEEEEVILPREARRRPKSTRDSISTEPPPPYELHDPARI